MPAAGCQSAAKVTSAAPGPVPGETTDSLWLTALAHNPEANGREAHFWSSGRTPADTKACGRPILEAGLIRELDLVASTGWIVSGCAVIQDFERFLIG